MRNSKQIVALLLALMILAGSVWAGAAPALAYDGKYRGRDFTDNSTLAAKLDNLFYGRAQIFKNDSKKYAVGDSYNPKAVYYWTQYNWGSSCLAYAQACYYYLFGEFSANPKAYLTKSYVALEKKTFLTYADFKNAKIGCGAYVRTTGNKDYSFNAANGHSFLVLSYDKEYITFLEGNADYHGLIAIQHMTWDTFNQRRMTNQGRRLCFVIQPKTTKGQIKLLSAGGTQTPATTVPPTTVLPETTAPAAGLAGDYNENGRVDAEDARFALRVAVGLESIKETSVKYKMLDVNLDGDVDSEDSRMILRFAVGLE